MVAAPETLVSAAAQPPPAPAHPTDSPSQQLDNASKDVKRSDSIANFSEAKSPDLCRSARTLRALLFQEADLRLRVPAENGAGVNEETASPGAESAASTSPANLPPAEVARNIPCRFFPLGQCKYGEHCIFSHGIPGTAGSPGVPPSPSVAAQVVAGQQGAQRQEHSLAQASGAANHQHPHHHQQQQQHHQHPHQPHYQHAAPQHHQFHPQQISMEQAYAMQAAGMPFYYPEQAGLEYGYAPQVAFGGPQPGYYYPPHFAAAANMQPPFPPQPYYAGPVPQPPLPSQQQPAVVAVEQQAVSPPPAAVSPSQSAVATSPQPTDAPAQDAPAESASVPAVTDAAAAAPIDPIAAAGGAVVPPVASLHTFFQTGPPAGMPPALLAAPNGVPYKNGVPRGPLGARRSIGGPNGPIVGPGGKRASFGTARPPCSFFEANRCRHGDKCLFIHLLPDGSDARGLGRGLIGIDGRTEHPEATGGMPPAWLATQKAIKAANHTARKHHEQGTILNGGYSYRERMSAQPNAHEQASAPVQTQEVNGEPVSAAPAEATQQAAVSTSAQEPSAPAPAAFQQPSQPQPQQQQQQRSASNSGSQRNGALPPGSAAPQLVAAINGLTRRIPPAHANKQGGPSAGGQRQGHQQQNGHHAQQQSGHKQHQPKSQRIPSGENDFPALSPAAPSSPAFEKEGFAAALAAPAPATVSAPNPVPAPAPATEKPAPVADAAKPTSPTDETEGFVMVSHSDAGVPAPTESKAEAPVAAPATPAVAAAPRPKLIGGWASAAARGASVVVPEKPKARAFSPVVVNRSATPAGEAKDAAPAKKEEPASAARKDSREREREKTDEDGFVRQQPKRKGNAHKANKAAAQHQQPVAIKA
ncbi:hypothetical protein JCM3774_002195 [Rhodotorula dairenensis]